MSNVKNTIVVKGLILLIAVSMCSVSFADAVQQQEFNPMELESIGEEQAVEAVDLNDQAFKPMILEVKGKRVPYLLGFSFEEVKTFALGAVTGIVTLEMVRRILSCATAKGAPTTPGSGKRGKK